MRSCGLIYAMARNSRSHCFTRIPKDAEVRLRMRLANQHTLTRMADVAAWNGGGCEEDVAFR